eukprot:5908787-Amphidinium_carterae.1
MFFEVVSKKLGEATALVDQVDELIGCPERERAAASSPQVEKQDVHTKEWILEINSTIEASWLKVSQLQYR